MENVVNINANTKMVLVVVVSMGILGKNATESVFLNMWFVTKNVNFGMPVLRMAVV